MTALIAQAMASVDRPVVALLVVLALIVFGLACLIRAAFINDRDRYRGGSDLHDG